ncbi:MAG TPA: serine/threonine-protein kinase, partial [Anaerolineales bacterium]
MSFNVGENVGPYRIVQQLGQGGMATVYKAFHAALDRYVAIKALHPAFGEDANFAARFQREARLVAKLDHPHIVPIYDYAQHEGRPYLVMKFIEGDTLKARLQKGPLTSAEIENVVDSVGSALAYAHRQGILHRDIKPSNVLIGPDGEMWLADFGLARIAQAPESTLSSDMIMGTPQYISPEQAMGDKKLDEGTDIYSFGVMLYEMVVGQVPFNADTPFSIIHDHIYSPLPMPRVINPRVPEQVERVLLKALAKDRADRYANVDALVQAFESAWTEAGVPMQGTAITMRPSLLKPAAATIAPKAPVSASAPPPGSETAIASSASAASTRTSISGAPAAVP